MNTTIFPPIPLDTVKAARTVFGRTNFYLVTGDKANDLFEGISLEDPMTRIQKPVCRIAKFYLITIFQYIETLPEHLAVEALRKRIEWKYALHLPVNYPGLEATWLCEFRQWLLVNRAGRQNLQTVLSRLSEVTDLNKGGEGLDSSQVISAVCQFSRLARIWDSLNQAMEALATSDPNWLLKISLPHWYERYGARQRNLDLSSVDTEMQSLAKATGADGLYLLKMVSAACDPGLSGLREVKALAEVWRQQFEFAGEGKLAWRKQVCAGCP